MRLRIVYITTEDGVEHAFIFLYCEDVGVSLAIETELCEIPQLCDRLGCD